MQKLLEDDFNSTLPQSRNVNFQVLQWILLEFVKCGRATKCWSSIFHLFWAVSMFEFVK